MKAEQYDEVESQIGYEFKNRLLLQQAFTRKSYTQETHDGENNEVLEFIGDKVLDLVIVKVLTEYYGEINNDKEYECEHNEGKLTEFKKHLVESKMLAERIDEMGFADYLIMGKGDIKNNVQNETHVKEDLFEAILGAVALDSDWEMDSMQDAVEMMLHLDCYLENGFGTDKDYVSTTSTNDDFFFFLKYFENFSNHPADKGQLRLDKDNYDDYIAFVEGENLDTAGQRLDLGA